MRRFMVVLAAFTACSAFQAGADPRANVIASWVQYTVDGVEVRVVAHDHCPTLEVDGDPAAMVQRAEPTADFPDVVCALELPDDVTSVSLHGRALPVPVDRPRRIVVMGDTGCRLSTSHGLFQECNNDSLWPFARVAASAERAAPDLIVYTGDYIYRESACPDGDNGCVGSPHGYKQDTWLAEWLEPAAPVHRAAPLLLIRGNHETCSRAGTGFFRYLGARSYSGGCEDSTDPWVVTLEKMQLAVMDVAELDADFAAQLDWLDKQLVMPSWITAHRTFWGFGADDDTGELTTPTEELQEAVREAGLPAETRLLVGAHIHLAEVLDFEGDRPPQLVVANSGTQLVPRVHPPRKIDGVAIRSLEVLYQYGFVVMDSQGNQKWRISFRDVENRELEACRLSGTRVRCKP